MSIAHVGKTLNNINQNIIRTMKEGCDLVVNQNSTQADTDKFWEDFNNVFKDSSVDLGDEARSQAREGVIKHLMDGGMSKAEAEALFADQWKKVLSTAEKVRKNMPRVEAAGKFAWLKLTGMITALAAATVAYTAYHSGPTPQEQAAIDTINRVGAENEQIERLTVSMDEFNSMMNGLTPPSAAPRLAAPPAAEAAPAAAEPVELPPAIAAIATAPARVEVTLPSGKQQLTTTVERVYRSSPPQVRRFMYQPLHIDHAYDHPSNDTSWHFPEHKSPSIHKNFTIDAGFASAHISF